MSTLVSVDSTGSAAAVAPSYSQIVEQPPAAVISSDLRHSDAAAPSSEAVSPQTQATGSSDALSIVSSPPAVPDPSSTLAEDLKALDVWARDPTTRFEWVSDELQLLQEQQKTLARVLEAREARNREKRRLLEQQRLLAEQQKHQQQHEQAQQALLLEPPSPPPVNSSADTPQALRPLENWAVQSQTPMDQLKYEMAMIRAQKSILKKAVRSRQHSRQSSRDMNQQIMEEKQFTSKPSSRVPMKEAPGQLQSNGRSSQYDQAAHDGEEEQQQGSFSMHSSQTRMNRQQSQRAEDRHNAYQQQQQQQMSQLYNYEDSADGIAMEDPTQLHQQQQQMQMQHPQLQFATYTKRSPLQVHTQVQYEQQQQPFAQQRPPVMAHHQLQIQLQNQRQKLALRQHQQLAELMAAQTEQMRLAEQQTILANGGLPLTEEQLAALHESLEHQFRQQQNQLREAHQVQAQQLAAQLQQTMQAHMNQHQPPQLMSPMNQHFPSQAYSTLQQRQEHTSSLNSTNNNSPFFQPQQQQHHSPYALNPLSHAPTLAFASPPSSTNSPSQLTIQPSDPDAVTKLTALLLQQVLSPTNLQAHGLTPMAQAALLGSGAPLPPLSDRGIKKKQQLQQQQQSQQLHLSPGSPESNSRSLLRPKKQVGWESGIGTGSSAAGGGGAASPISASQFPLVSGDLETRSFSADLVIAQTRADAAMSKHVSRAAARQLAEAARLSQIEEQERRERERREQDFQKRLMAQRRAKARLEARLEKNRAGELQEELAVTEERRRKKAERKLARQRARGTNGGDSEEAFDENLDVEEADAADGQHNGKKLPSLKHVQATVPSHIVSGNPYMEAMLAAEKRRQMQQRQQSQSAGEGVSSSNSESDSDDSDADSTASRNSRRKRRREMRKQKHKRKQRDDEEDEEVSSYDSQDSRSRTGGHDYLRRRSHRSGSRLAGAASHSRSRIRSPLTDAYLRKKGAKVGPGEGPSNFMKFSDKGQNIHGTFGTFVSDHVLLYGDRKSPSKGAIKKGASSRSRSRRALSASPAAARASRRLKKKPNRRHHHRSSKRSHRSRAAARSDHNDENDEEEEGGKREKANKGPRIRVVPKGHVRGHSSTDFQRRGESAIANKSPAAMDGEEEYANEGFEPISPGAAADAAAAEQAAAAAIIDWDHGAGAIALKQASDFLLMERDATRAREATTTEAVAAVTTDVQQHNVVEQKKMEEVRDRIASTGGDILHTHPLHLSDQLKAAAKLQKKQQQAAAQAANRASSSEADQKRSLRNGRFRSRSHSRDSSLPSSVASSADRLRRRRAAAGGGGGGRGLHRHQPSSSDYSAAPQTEQGEQTATATEFAPSSSSSSVSPSKYRSASHARVKARAGSVLLKPSSQFAAPPRFVRPSYDSSDDEKPPMPKIGKRIKGPLPPPPLKPTLSSQKKKNKKPIVKYRDRQKDKSLRSPLLLSPSKSTSPSRSHKISNSGLISPLSTTNTTISPGQQPFSPTAMLSPNSMRVGSGENGQLVRQDSVQRKILPDGSEEITTVTTIIQHVKPGESPGGGASSTLSPASLTRKLESGFHPTNVSGATLDTIFDSPALRPGRPLVVKTDLASPTSPIKAHPVVTNHYSLQQQQPHPDEEEQAVQQALASPAPLSPIRAASTQPHEESSSALDPALLHPPPPERGSLMNPTTTVAPTLSPHDSNVVSPSTSAAPSPSASRPNTKGKQREKLWSAGKAPPARQRSEVIPVKLWDAHATSRTVSQIMKDTTLSEEEKMKYLEEWLARKSGAGSTTDSPVAATPPLEKKRSFPSKNSKHTPPQQQQQPEEMVPVKAANRSSKKSQAPTADASSSKKKAKAAGPAAGPAAKKKSSIVAGTGSSAVPVATETAPPAPAPAAAAAAAAADASAARSPSLSRIPSLPSSASHKKASPADKTKLTSPSGIKPPNQFFSTSQQQPAVATKATTSTKKNNAAPPAAAAARKYAVNNDKSPGQSQEKNNNNNKPTRPVSRNSPSKLPTSKKREEESKQQHPSPKRVVGVGAAKNNKTIVPHHPSQHAGVSITSLQQQTAAAEEDPYADEGYDNEFDNEFEPEPDNFAAVDAAAAAAAAAHHVTRGGDDEEDNYDQDFDNMASAEYGEDGYQQQYQQMNDEYADEQFIDA